MDRAEVQGSGRIAIRRWAPLVAIAMVVVFAASCGGDEDAAPTTTAAPTKIGRAHV